MKIKAALLLCLMSAAALSISGAYRSLHRIAGPVLPEEVAARFVGRENGAEYFLRDRDGYVAVLPVPDQGSPCASPELRQPVCAPPISCSCATASPPPTAASSSTFWKISAPDTVLP